MASFTQVTKAKRNRRKRNAGRARKAKMAQRSTLSYDELFAGCGAPSNSAPAAGKSAAATAG